MPIRGFGDPKPPISKLFYPTDFIEFSRKVKSDFSKEFIEKYKKGFSAKEIAREHGCSKQKVLATLKRNKVNIRPSKVFTTLEAMRKKGRRNRKPFYGFCYFEGQIAKHTAEFPVLLIIHNMWQSGKSIHYINLELNKCKFKAREGGKWSWASVRNIVQRFEDKNVLIHKDGKYEFL